TSHPHRFEFGLNFKLPASRVTCHENKKRDEKQEVHMPEWSAASRRPLPLILIRGFGGLGIEDEKRIAYQGFNDGTVYPNKRGDNYIYEGMILKFMKSAWQYQDATNVVGYFPTPVVDATRPADLTDLPDNFFFQPPGSEESVQPLYKVVIDAA